MNRPRPVPDDPMAPEPAKKGDQSRIDLAMMFN